MSRTRQGSEFRFVPYRWCASFSEWLPEDDAYQTFLEDEFTFKIALAAKGQKRLILPQHQAT